MGINGFNANLSIPTAFQKAGKAAREYTERVNRYDKAASEPGLSEQWATRSGKWGARASLSMLGDRIYTADSNSPTISKLASRLQPLAKNSTHYADWMGIGWARVEKPEGMSWQHYVKEGTFRKDYRISVRANFENAFRAEHRAGLSLKSFFSKTLIGSNAANIYEPLTVGRVCTSMGALGGLGLAGYSIFSKTRDAYRYATSQQNWGDAKIVTYTAKHCLFEAFKTGLAWEAASIGGALGAGLFCIGTWPLLIGTWVIGGLFGALTYTALGKLMPQPPKVNG